MNHWMFKCTEVTKKVSESLDRKLPLHHRILIRMHLLMCRFCSRYKEQLLILKEAIRLQALTKEALESSATLSAQARDRIKRALLQES